jgi:glycosyltransferase involved in cell wall biosynthesis
VVIPHIVSLPDCDDNLRETLNIPKDVIVFGRYGGKDEFNIPDTKQAIQDYLYYDSSMYFLFMNTVPFYDHPNIIYVKGNLDPIYKVSFINTCDAMIHSREMGETFGLSIAEFSSKNKPVITCPCGDLEHIRILGDRAILYHNKDELFDIFCNIRQIIGMRNDWNAYSKYTPSEVMSLFREYIFDR